MVKAFLIVWTLVAGLAAGSLMYIVGWRPQASGVTEQVSPVKPSALPAAPADASSHQIADAAAGPTSTGSLAPSRSATRTVRRIDGVAASPSAPDPAADRAPDQTAALDRRNDATSARAGETIARPPTRTAPSPQGSAPLAGPPPASAKRPDIVRLPLETDAEADPAAQRIQAADRKASERQAGLNTPATAPAPLRSRLDAAPVVRPKENATRSEPDTASASTEATQTGGDRVAAATRAADRRAARTAAGAARTAERQEREKEQARVAEAGESQAETRRRLLETRQLARAEQRQARVERRTRVARNGSLESLLDDFSRSGADYLHERTIRVGTRYLVERTTRHGTQYFYEGR